MSQVVVVTTAPRPSLMTVNRSTVVRSHDNRTIIPTVEKSQAKALIGVGSMLWKIFIAIIPVCLLLSCAYALRGMLIHRGPSYSTNFVDLLRDNWASFESEFNFTEMWISFVGWSTTNLFIRRLMNPEIGLDAFEKYGADSIMGGITIACSFLLKAVMRKSLKDLRQQ